MHRNCIIGGGPTGSREHIFPAALGGRRTNKGIYCGKHNNAFAPLAEALAVQMKAINALLGVRPDHSDKPQTLTVSDSKGQKWNVTADGVAQDGAAAGSGGTLMMPLTLGGPDGLRAIAYVALTFFAHHFSDEAQREEFDPIKQYIQGNSENDFAWWEDAVSPSGIPINPFPFGHTIALVTDCATGDALAFVSLFSSLNFGVSLGRIEGCRDRTAVIFIDPHADHAPHDIKEIITDEVGFGIRKPDPLYAHLKKMIEGNAAESNIQKLLERIEKWKFSNEMALTLQHLNKTQALGEAERKAAIINVVENNTTRIHRLLVHFSKDFNKKASADIGSVATAMLLEGVTARDPSDPSKLTDAAAHATAAGMKAIASELEKRLASRPLEMDDLWFLFSGTDGLKIVVAALMDELRESAERNLKETLNLL